MHAHTFAQACTRTHTHTSWRPPAPGSPVILSHPPGQRPKETFCYSNHTLFDELLGTSGQGPGIHLGVSSPLAADLRVLRALPSSPTEGPRLPRRRPSPPLPSPPLPSSSLPAPPPPSSVQPRCRRPPPGPPPAAVASKQHGTPGAAVAATSLQWGVPGISLGVGRTPYRFNHGCEQDGK